MLRNIFLFAFLIFFAPLNTFAAEIPIKITPLVNITTSTNIIKEGDNVEFVVLDDVYNGSKLLFKKCTVASGMVSSIVENSFDSKEATILIDNFVIYENDKRRLKLKGSVYKTGNNHPVVYGISLGLYAFVRGGEAFIKHNKDFYTLYFEVISD